MKVYFILISIILCVSLNFYIFKNNKKKFIIGLFLTVSILFFTYNFKSNIDIFDYASSLEIDLKNSSELDPIKLILFLEKKLSENPEDLEGWKILARTCMLTGYVQKANKYYLKAIDLIPKDIELLSEYAFFKRNNNKLSESIIISERINLINPEDIDNLVFLTQLYSETNNTEKFEELIEILKSKNIDSQIIKELKENQR
jgi:tetratricopeptide (TPR) repeat protein